jgi:biopolymer transport protein ExbB
MLEFLAKGGKLMYPLGFFSVVALGVVLEKLWALRGTRVLGREVSSVIEEIDSPEDFERARVVCVKYPGPLARIVEIALRRFPEGNEALREGVLEAGRGEARGLERYLVVLETIAVTAPLLGLLGTVFGMIKTFTAISVEGIGQAGALSGGISEALITTAVGLSIGVPALIAFNLLEARVEGLAAGLESRAGRLVARLEKIQSERTGGSS